MGFRRIDIGNPDILALEPDCIAINHTVLPTAGVAKSKLRPDAIFTEECLWLLGPTCFATLKPVRAYPDEQADKNCSEPEARIAGQY